MKLVIIGAGVAGLVSLKYALDYGHKCDTFEQTDELGGTWVYTDKHGSNEYGFPIHRNMYKGLKTNIPKEEMEFLDFPYQSDVDGSFISQPEVLQYLKDYAQKFELEKHIQYSTAVTKVSPNENKWVVTVRDVKTQAERLNYYDAVFVCNGHFFHPRIPKIKGQNVFQGLQMHSRDYRSPDMFKNKRILIMGAAFSAIDIAKQLSKQTKCLYMSHWKPVTIDLPNIVVKPGVKELHANGVLFTDGSQINFDVILYCTGYEYNFPFLTAECCIKVEDNWVRYLYKHIINVQFPTLCFIGIPFSGCPFPMCDIQARFALSSIEGKFKLPSNKSMMEEINDHVGKLKSENVPQRRAHALGVDQGVYFADLAKIAGIRPIPPVISNIHKHRLTTLNISEVHKVNKYIIVDDDSFIEII